MKSLPWLLQLVLSSAAAVVMGQGIGTADAPPRLVTEKCTARGGCVRQNTSLVLDASFHGLRARDDQDQGGSCGGGIDGGPLSAALCPDAEACARNCVLDGAEYEGNGVLADGSGAGVVLRQYMRRKGEGEGDETVEKVSPRVYLLEDSEGQEEGGGAGERNYEMLYLKNQEISFDVDVSKLVCGMNGALYLAEMNATGGRGELNPAGAQYGTGYCDAQCPKLPFINGVANIESRGSCCTEMDLWEANAFAAAFTGHTCSEPGQYACAGGECGAIGVCSKSGCEYNTYRLGNKTFYGGGGDATVDTTRPFTVTTQFLTNTGDATAGAILNEIRRLYVQDGRVIANAAVADPYMPPGDSIKMSHCQASVAGTFENLGGLRQMGRALDRGTVLVARIWNDDAAFMNWLDAGDAGPCSVTEGDPALIAASHADTQVAFSNIRWGDLGSTYTAGAPV